MVTQVMKARGVLLSAVLITVPVLALEEHQVATASGSGSIPSTATLLQQMGKSDREVEAEPPVASIPSSDEALFRRICSQCHDPERATSKRKTYDEWLGTVYRMAAKVGANIPERDIDPIATYLASLNPVETNNVQNAGTPTVGEVMAASSVSLHATVSLIWRRGEQQVENAGFFPDVWVGGDWRPKDSPFSAQVMACTTCHGSDPGSVNKGLKAELVEGSFSANVLRLVRGRKQTGKDSGLKVVAKAGRFIVPFGAYSGMAHPGVYRTLTNPLMYNMGRRIQAGYPDPVIPMPYCDEGADLHVGVPLPAGFLTRMDAYAVNGLQDNFTFSRSYTDNNSNTALGGRVAIGNAWVQIGGSYSSGEPQSFGPKYTYRLEGGDLVLHYEDIVRAYYEYARREKIVPGGRDGQVEGHVGELEGRIWKNPGISLLVRYDTLDHSGSLGNDSVDRFTWGGNLVLPGGSLLIINEEHWMFGSPRRNEDVLGFRWVATF